MKFEKHSVHTDYMWNNKKKEYKWTYLQNRNSHRCRKQIYDY